MIDPNIIADPNVIELIQSINNNMIEIKECIQVVVVVLVLILIFK